jgi:hypothetical protein
MLPEPPELGNEDPVFLSLLERARARTGPDPDPCPETYAERWVRLHLPDHVWHGFACGLWTRQQCGGTP